MRGTSETGKHPSRRISEEVLSWPGVTAVPHRFGGIEFRIGRRQLGHLHGEQTADLPLRRATRDQLVAAGKAQVHRWRPDSGWVTVHIDSEVGIADTIRLLRASYERATRRRTEQPPAQTS